MEKVGGGGEGRQFQTDKCIVSRRLEKRSLWVEWAVQRNGKCALLTTFWVNDQSCRFKSSNKVWREFKFSGRSF